MRRSLGLGLLAGILPAQAGAHSAFGDLGGFYGGLLHPLADPAQGLLLAAAATFLARQPLSAVRIGYAALVLAALLAGVAATLGAAPSPGPVLLSAATLVLALGAVAGIRPAEAVTAGAVAGAGALATLAADPPAGAGMLLSLAGGLCGVAAASLMVLGAIDCLERRVHPVAGAVAGSWIAAVALMTAVLQAAA